MDRQTVLIVGGVTVAVVVGGGLAWYLYKTRIEQEPEAILAPPEHTFDDEQLPTKDDKEAEARDLYAVKNEANRILKRMGDFNHTWWRIQPNSLFANMAAKIGELFGLVMHSSTQQEAEYHLEQLGVQFDISLKDPIVMSTKSQISYQEATYARHLGIFIKPVHPEYRKWKDTCG